MQRLAGARSAGSDRGSVSVVVALLMVALLGFTALVVDVGATYAERRQLQNGADAAALGIAQDCAKKLPACSQAGATAETLGDANVNDGSAVFTPEFQTARSVKVTTSDVVEHYFAPILGVDGTTVDANATAAWGGLKSGPAMLPIVFAKCLFDPTKIGIERWIIYKDNKAIPSCDVGDGPPGGFGWLDSDGHCSALVDIATPEYVHSDPGNSFISECTAVLETLKTKPALLPVYTESSGTGQSGVYTLYGFAAFQLTGWRLGGSGESRWNDGPPCNGDCRGVKGKFTTFVSLQDYTMGGPLDLGTTTVSLTS